ncbi:MAG: type II toxin-antitoxin system VapC family toxin [Flavobacterium sp.]|nr:type II toxin-antitoxin system VapC family toxin [Flavobacterium sp.]
MIGNKVLLDSNVLILASKHLINIEKLVDSFDEFFVSIITYMEIYSYNFPNKKEEELLRELLNNITITPINKEIADLTIEIRKSKTKKIKLPDAIILATAKYLNLTLLTDDWGDFENIDSSILISNIDFRNHSAW